MPIHHEDTNWSEPDINDLISGTHKSEATSSVNHNNKCSGG